MRRRHGALRGGVVVLAGPDGTGKSTLFEHLRTGVFANVPVRRFHHRYKVLPARVPETDASRPHAKRPYARPLCWLKVLYLFVDYLLGWFLLVRPLVRRGGWVVMERDWWDLSVDQLRYRLQGSGALLRALGRLLPAPDLVIVLLAPPATLRERKLELTEEELARQVDVWHHVLPRRVSRVRLDSSMQRSQLVGQATQAVTHWARRRGRWLGDAPGADAERRASGVWVNGPGPLPPDAPIPRVPAGER